MKIGIIGAGFVGSAIKNAYDNYEIPIILHDPAKGFTATWEELRLCDGIFLCVPSPTLPSGECDTSILKEVLGNLSGMEGVIISKVTAPPSVYTSLQVLYPNLVHAPEFLVAATANEDYIHGTFGFIGGEETYTKMAEEIIRAGQRNLQDVRHSTIAEASLAKYSINSFLALKVSYMNQLYDLCQASGINFNNLITLLQVEKRVGTSHFHVPGPDKKRGFGGACFPKDTSALHFEASKSNIDLSVLKSAIDYNKIIRKD
jgi:UDPglucose 6-dehydrogenase